MPVSGISSWRSRIPSGRSGTSRAAGRAGWALRRKVQIATQTDGLPPRSRNAGDTDWSTLIGLARLGRSFLPGHDPEIGRR